MINFKNKKVFKLKREDGYADAVADLIHDSERVMSAYKSLRDGVVFTTKRIITINIQGVTGSRKAYTSIPYQNIDAFSVETAGTLDIDSSLEAYISSMDKIRFEVTGQSNMADISKVISDHIFG